MSTIEGGNTTERVLSIYVTKRKDLKNPPAGDETGEEYTDYRTGEVIHGDREYERFNISPLFLHDDSRIHSAPRFGTLTSLNQRDRFMAKVDNRRLFSINNCRFIYDSDRGRSALDKSRPLFKTATYKKLKPLVDRIDYCNYLYTTAEKLADDLDIHPKSVTRYLRSLAPMVKVFDMRHGLKKGVLRIAVSPAYGYKMEPEHINQERYMSCIIWYRGTPKKEFADIEADFPIIDLEDYLPCF